MCEKIIMNILDVIRNDKDLENKVMRLCDFELYDEFFSPESLDNEMKFNINGKAFGASGDGSEFILLDDSTIGLNGSEGIVGRIAENMHDLFSLLINCPCFFDFMLKDLYFEENKELFRKFCKGMEISYKNSFNRLHYKKLDYDTVKYELSDRLGIELDDDISENTMRKFYQVAMKEPRYGYFYKNEFYCDSFFRIKPRIALEDWVNRMIS